MVQDEHFKEATFLISSHKLKAHTFNYTLATKNPGRHCDNIGNENRTCDSGGKPLGQQGGHENDGTSEIQNKITCNLKARGGRVAILDKENRTSDCRGKRDVHCQGWSRCPENDGSLIAQKKIERNRRARRVTGRCSPKPFRQRKGFEASRGHRDCQHHDL